MRQFPFCCDSVNTAAPLAVCIKEEQRAVIRFPWSEDVSGTTIHRRLATQYGDSALLRRCVYEWVEKIKRGRTNLMHDEGADHLSTSTTVEKLASSRDDTGESSI